MKKRKTGYLHYLWAGSGISFWQIVLRDAPPIHDPRLDDLKQ